ncbi:MAG: dihydrolipoyl dehydrogenase, partial [Gemmatimonadales bacterium]
LDTLAGLTDPAVVDALRDALGQEFPVHTGNPAELSEAHGRIAVSGGGGSFVADAVLAALGRTSNADTLGLDDLDLAAHGVEVNDKGLPQVDETTLQVGDLPLFLAGDANARLPLLHEAADDGFIAGRNALADTSSGFCRRVPLVIAFTSPGVARVGTRFADLDADSAVVGSFDFSRQARARMAERAQGLLRVYADRGSGRLLGAEMCLPDAEHMAHLLALAMHQELTVHDLLGMPFYHPVLEEGLRSALRDLARKVETRASGDSDLAACPALEIPALD